MRVRAISAWPRACKPQCESKPKDPDRNPGDPAIVEAHRNER
jgi:hypothetical protein